MKLQNKNKNYQIEVIPREGLVTVGFLTRLRELECAYDNPQTTNRNLSGKQTHRFGTYYLFPDKTATTPCQPVTKPIFRFSWTYNTVIHQYLAIGIAPNFHGQGQTIVYSTSPDMLHWAPPRALLQISWMNSNPNQTGIGYPSLLDPSSAGRNFVYSGAHPYLYYTRFNPRSPEFNRRNRDLVRVPLAVTYKAVDY